VIGPDSFLGRYRLVAHIGAGLLRAVGLDATPA
jgi:hypothetical protein